jgi:hypothetical protein
VALAPEASAAGVTTGACTGAQQTPVPARAMSDELPAVLRVGAVAPLAVEVPPAPEPTPPPAPALAPLPPEPMYLLGPARGPDPRRDPLYFRGRVRPPDPMDSLLLVPRVLLYPLHVITEYGVRIPLRALVTFGERHGLFTYLLGLLEPASNFSLIPTFHLYSGFIPSFGLQFQWSNFLVPGNNLRLAGSTGGSEVWDVSASDRIALGPYRVGIAGRYFTRPDMPFYGIGPQTSEDNLTHFTLSRGEVFGRVGFKPTALSAVNLFVGYRHDETGPGNRPSIQTRFPHPALTVPGFGPLSLAMMHADLAIDSRPSWNVTHGVRFTAHGVLAIDTQNAERAFVVGDAELQVGVEIFRRFRVLTASVWVANSAQLGREQVPFTYLPYIGLEHMPGFRRGRYIDRSAFVAELAYHHPIWDHLDAYWVANVGNVFGPNWQGFNAELFAGSLGFGLRTARINNVPAIDLILAVGTHRFDQPFGIEGFQVYAALDRGL